MRSLASATHTAESHAKPRIFSIAPTSARTGPSSSRTRIFGGLPGGGTSRPIPCVKGPLLPCVRIVTPSSFVVGMRLQPLQAGGNCKIHLDAHLVLQRRV